MDRKEGRRQAVDPTEQVTEAGLQRHVVERRRRRGRRGGLFAALGEHERHGVETSLARETRGNLHRRSGAGKLRASSSQLSIVEGGDREGEEEEESEGSAGRSR